MPRPIWTALAAAGLAALLSACLPREMPSYSPDGQSIALLAANNAEGDHPTLWLYDPKTKTARPCPLPPGWLLDSAQWIGDQLWVVAGRDIGERRDPKTHEVVIDPKTGQPARQYEYAFAPFDPKTLTFGKSPLKVSPDHYAPYDMACVIGYKGRPALLVEDLAEARLAPLGRTAYDVYPLDVLAAAMKNASALTQPATQETPPVTTAAAQSATTSEPAASQPTTASRPAGPQGVIAEMSRVIPAGFGWSIRIVEVENNLKLDFKEVQICDATGFQLCSVTALEAAPACITGARIPKYARVSRDGTAILLAFDTASTLGKYRYAYTFGVFDTTTGNMLWMGQGNPLFGTPLVTRDEVWDLESALPDVPPEGEDADPSSPLPFPPAPGMSHVPAPATLPTARTPSVPTSPATNPAAPLVIPNATKVLLVRHRAAAKRPDWEMGDRSIILTLDIGPHHTAGEYAPAPDSKSFLLALHGQPPRLAFLPIRPDAKPQDVTLQDLTAPKK